MLEGWHMSPPPRAGCEGGSLFSSADVGVDTDSQEGGGVPLLASSASNPGFNPCLIQGWLHLPVSHVLPED